jgi:Protein of unknown function (DUF4242)
MPLFMDVHYSVLPDLGELTDEVVREGHAKDLAVQDKYGVRFVKYWYDEKTGRAFCLAEAPSKEAFEACHREAHGILADEIWEVNEGE